MSSHADTIRATDELWRTTPADLAEWSMRASEMKTIARSLLAENQQLRDALNLVLFTAKFNSKEYEIAREALAGDAE